MSQETMWRRFACQQHQKIKSNELMQKLETKWQSQVWKSREVNSKLICNEFFIQGWGLVPSGIASNILLKATVPYVPNADCVEAFSSLPHVSIYPTYLCAGGLKNKTDTCKVKLSWFFTKKDVKSRCNQCSILFSLIEIFFFFRVILEGPFKHMDTSTINLAICFMEWCQGELSALRLNILSLEFTQTLPTTSPGY